MGLSNNNRVKAQSTQRQNLLNEAKKDIGKFEGLNNSGFTVKYHNAILTAYKRNVALNAPYCGMAVFTWHYLANINTTIKNPETAANWFRECKNPRTFINMTTNDFNNIKGGTVVVFKLKYGYHVGIVTKAENYTLYTIEANTSTARSIIKYNKKGQGVFELKTKLNANGIKPFALCDCIGL